MTDAEKVKSSSLKPVAGFILKSGLAAVLLYLLYKSGRLDFASFSRMDPGAKSAIIIIAGALSVFAGQFLLAFRLRLLLSRTITVPFPRIFGLTLIGSFSGAVLPGLIMGDAVKTAYLFGDAGSNKGRVLAVVITDRAIGVFSLFALGTITSALAWTAGVKSIPASLFLVAPVVAAGAIVAAVLAAWIFSGSNRPFQSRIDRLPEQLRGIGTTFGIYARNPSVLAKAVALSIANHSMVVVSFIAAGTLLKDDLSLLSHLVVNPLAMVMNIVPFTPGGIGLTEGTFSFLHEAAGSDLGATVGLLGRMIQYIVFIIGGTAALLIVRMGVAKGDSMK